MKVLILLLFNFCSFFFIDNQVLAVELAKVNETEFYFVGSDNQVKLLNQKLEYRIPDQNTLQIGNLIVSNQNLKLILKDSNTLIFEGPKQFMFGGTLILKDPHGRALWSQPIDDLDQLEQDSTLKKNESELRTESTRFILSSLSSIRSELVQNSFFTFCIFTESALNRIQTCTPNYVLTESGETLNLNLQSKKPQENVVIVNGTEANEHGIIQFDKNVKSVSLAVRLSSGLLFEAKTDYIELDLLDSIHSPNDLKVNLILREKRLNNKKIYPWKTQVAINDPYFYIEAFGQIPLRQELSFKTEDLPLSTDRPEIIKNFNRTYSSSVSVPIKIEPKLVLKSKTKGDSVTKSSEYTLWNINNLKYGLNKPHHLDVLTRGKSFKGAYEVERGQSWNISSSIGESSLTGNSLNNGDKTNDSGQNVHFELNKYFNTFFGMDGKLNYLRWGTHLEAGIQDYSKSKTKSQWIDYAISYRLNSNFNHLESSTYFSLSTITQSITNESEKKNLSWIGLKVGHEGPSKTLNFLFGNHHKASIGYYPKNLNTLEKKSSLSRFSWESQYEIKPEIYWNWRFVGENSITNQSIPLNSSLLLGIQLGLGFYF